MTVKKRRPSWNSLRFFFGAQGETRTCTPLQALRPERVFQDQSEFPTRGYDEASAAIKTLELDDFLDVNETRAERDRAYRLER